LSRLLITGGAGFLGGGVTKVLAARGHQILVFDNLSQGHLASLPHGTPVIVGDLQDFFAVENLFAQHEFDAVIHLAALTGADISVTQPLRHYRENVTGLLNLLLAMRIARVNKLVFCSDANVYGLPDELPVAETAPVRPVTPFGWSKAMCEQILTDARAAHSLHCITFRVFEVAGATAQCGEAHNPETHLIPRLLDAAMGKLPGVEAYGTDHSTPDGTAVRDILHIVDAAEAIARAVDLLEEVSGTFNERVTGREIKVTEHPRRPAYASSFVANIEQAKSKLGWEPRHKLEDILRSAWSWRQRNPDGYPSVE